MDFDLSDMQTMVRDSVERLLASEYDFAARQRIVASPDGFSRDIWRRFASLGLLGLTIPESLGGLGMGAVELGIVMEAFGGALVVEPYWPTMIGSAGIVELGDEKQREAILPGVAEGRIQLAFAHSERGCPIDIAPLATTATRVAGGWVLKGHKTSVVGATAADQLIVSARIGRAGTGLFLVPRDAAGLSIDGYVMLDGSRAANVALGGVRLAADALLGQNEDAGPGVEMLVDRAITALAEDALGVIDALVAATADYARTRVQFGQPIGKFQALQHRMAEMAVLREEARSLSLYATLSIAEPPLVRARAASAAKIKVGRAVKQIAEQAVQIHGAMGVTDELSIGAYVKRALVFNLLLGSVEDHLGRYARIGRESDLLSRGLAERESQDGPNLRGVLAG